MLTILILFSVNFAAASDLDNETLMLHESSLESSVEETSQDVLTDNSPGSFADLKDAIDTSSDELTLNESYEFNSNDNANSINIYYKSLTIDGNGHTIDAKNKSSIFEIMGYNVTLKNLIFKNANSHAIDAFSVNLKVINCTFTDSYCDSEGGAIHSYSCTIDIINSTFTNNFANKGGALYYIYSNDCLIENSTFINNSAINGGAVFIYSSKFHTINKCLFENNSAFTNNYAYDGGGAINFLSSGLIANSTFKGNKASHGGSVRWEGTGTTTVYGNIFNCTFENDHAFGGGSVFMSLGKGSGISSSSFNNCSAESYGGVMYAAANYVVGITVVNSSFTNNNAKTGGALYWSNFNSEISGCNFTNNTASEAGGTIYVTQRELDMFRCNFENSNAPQGGIIYIKQSASKPSNMRVSNSTFKNANATNGGVLYAVDAVGISFKNCSFENTSAKNYGGVSYGYKSYIVFADSNIANSKGLYGGAIASYYGSASLSNISFENVSGASHGGVIYSQLAVLNVSDMVFKNHSARYYGGAIYTSQGTCNVESVLFENLYAGYYGAAIYSSKSSLNINNSQFMDNTVGYYGGALYDTADFLILNNSYFKGNNATFGSAIFKGSSANAVIENTEFVENQADSYSITITRSGKNFQAVFKGKDNILNAIWNNDDASSVTVDGNAVVKGSTPGKVFQDSREYDQIIIVTVLDKQGNVIESQQLITGTYGEVNFTAEEGYEIVFTHPEDNYYKYCSNSAYIPNFEVTKTVLTPEVSLNEQATFEIKVVNTGNVDLINLTICEYSFDGLIFDYANTDLPFNNLTWTVDKLAVGDNIAFNVTFDTTAFGLFTNEIVVTGEGIKKTAKDSVKVIYSHLNAQKLSLMPVTNVGNQTIFEILVFNDGEEDLYDVYILEDSFEGLIFDHTHEDLLWNYEFVNGKHKWTIKNALYANEYAGIFIVFNTTEVGNFTNFATVGYHGINMSVNATVEVVEVVTEVENTTAQMNVSIKTINPIITLGEQAIFEIIVHNIGNVMLTNVTIEEFKHEGLIFDSFIDASGLWDFKSTTIANAIKKELLGATIINNVNSWTISIPLYVNEYLGFFVVFNSTATGRFSNTVFGISDQTDMKFASDFVDVVHRTERNKTSSAESNNTYNANANTNSNAGTSTNTNSNDASTTNTQNGNNANQKSNKTSKNSVSSTYKASSSEKYIAKASSSKLEQNATGNPVLALLFILTCLVLIRRRNG